MERSIHPHDNDMTVELAALPKPVVNETQCREQQEMETGPPPSNTRSSNGAPPRNKLRHGLALFALYLSIYIASLDIIIATSSIPNITSFFNNSVVYAWVGTAYHLAFAVMIPIWGPIATVGGHKNVLLIALVAFATGAALSGWAPFAELLLIGRSIQGGAASGISILVYLCIKDLISTSNKEFHHKWTDSAWISASAIAPSCGGWFTQIATWRWNWWLSLIGSGVAFVLLAFCLDIVTPRGPFRRTLKSVNWYGIASMLIMVVVFLLGLNLRDVYENWSPFKAASLLVLGCAAALFFIIHESYYARRPLLPIHILRLHSNKACLLVCCTHGFINMAALYFLPLYFQVCQSQGPFKTGLFLLPVTITHSVAGLGASLFIHRTGHYLPLIYLGMALTTLGYGLSSMLSAASTSYLYISIAFSVIMGLGIGLTAQPPLVAMQASLEYMDMEEAAVLYGLAKNVCTAIALATGTINFENLIYNNLQAGLPDKFSWDRALTSVDAVRELDPRQAQLVKNAFAQSLRTMWIIYACWSGVGLLTSFLIKGRKLNPSQLQNKTATDNATTENTATANTANKAFGQDEQ